MQEALTNALRHAPVGEVQITVNCRDALALTVQNGPPSGAGRSTVGGGRGLAGLRERVEQSDGTITWGSTPSGGWRLDLVLR